MRLLSPKQTGDAKAAELQRDLLRTQELDEASERSIHRFNQTQADFNKMLAENRESWSEEEQIHAKRVEQMEREISLIENRREKALAPIHMREKEADDALHQAKGILAQAKEREEYSEELAETLQDKLDNLGHREQNIIGQEMRARMLEQGALQQQETIRKHATSLSEAQEKFVSEKIAFKQEEARIREDVRLQQISIDTKLENISHKEQAIWERERRVSDREATLKRNMERLSPKNPAVTESMLEV